METGIVLDGRSTMLSIHMLFLFVRGSFGFFLPLLRRSRQQWVLTVLVSSSPCLLKVNVVGVRLSKSEWYYSFLEGENPN